MKTQPIRFQLSQETINHIEKNTRCSIEELRKNSISDVNTLMVKRGIVKETHKIKEWFSDKYRQFGEKLGLLKKEYNIYSDID